MKRHVTQRRIGRHMFTYAGMRLKAAKPSCENVSKDFHSTSSLIGSDKQENKKLKCHQNSDVTN